ncbi:MAG TPA: GNAT family N-acetyltransferase [Puia sp.]|nr:GNAT family N-acetyltransferase [Puia sp.]
MEDISIRVILPSDNAALAAIIRSSLAEFGANHPGTVYYDETTDNLYQLFQKQNSIYFVATVQDEIAGGGGIFLSDGLPEDTCELVKMYLKKTARGLGLGKSLIEKCLEFAKEIGFKKVYIESMPELKKALGIYEKFGFKYLNSPMGNTGHFGCDIWMLKEL